MKPTLLLRADASREIGVGHVMRCLALAQAWQDGGGAPTLVAATLPPPLEARLQREKVAVTRIAAEVGGEADARTTVRLAHERGAAWVVVDGYRFGPGYCETLRAAGLRVLAIDDMAHQSRYPVDLLLNQNLSATPELYACKVEQGVTELLLGPRFSLLRREFRRTPPRARTALAEPRRVLLTLGGADAENLTAAALRNLGRSGRTNFHVIVLAGAANPHVAELRALAAAAPFACEVRVDAPDVAALMTWADAAITAGGSTVWELACLRVPALIGAIEDNQLTGLAALARVPFFRAMRAEELVACDLGSELDRLCSAASFDVSGDFDAGGARRVAGFLQAAAVALSLP